MLHCRMHGVVAECMELLRNAWISCGMHEIPVGDVFQKNALFFLSGLCFMFVLWNIPWSISWYYLWSGLKVVV